MSCKCGCNGVANPGKDYINGHQRRGKKFSSATIDKMRASVKTARRRSRPCAVCENEFLPDHSRRTTCGPECKKALKQSVRLVWLATPAGKASAVGSEKARRENYAANPQKVRDSVLRSNYGITRDEWKTLYGKQEGLCAICCEVLDRGRKTHVDHCHQTEKVRGLLCGKCNVAVGMLKDDPELMRASARYVEFHTAASAA